MPDIAGRFVGVGLYFDDLDRARDFYTQTLGIPVSDEQVGRYAKLRGEAGFVRLERKGSETYPSQEKAVVLFEVPDLEAAISVIGQEKFVHREPAWAVLHDPEGHNVLLLQAGSERERPIETDERKRFLLQDHERRLPVQFVGIKLFFDDLDRASEFYGGVLGREADDDDPGCFVAYHVDPAGYFCLYHRESPEDKAVLCFETDDIDAADRAIGETRMTDRAPRWAILEDPEGHWISIVQRVLPFSQCHG